MQNYCDTSEREYALEDSISHLQAVNKRIAKLNLLKERLVDDIIGAFGHEHEGQKSYEYGAWKVEIKTPFIYSLNKKAYEENGAFVIPEKFNPIKQSVSYSIDKKHLDECLKKAPSEVRDILIELIDKKPGKANVTIKERV